MSTAGCLLMDVSSRILTIKFASVYLGPHRPFRSALLTRLAYVLSSVGHRAQTSIVCAYYAVVLKPFLCAHKMRELITLQPPPRIWYKDTTPAAIPTLHTSPSGAWNTYIFC